MNSIRILRPYQFHGQWVFDDPEKGLVREPFVGGADRMISIATHEIPNADLGFLMIFSDRPFPDATIHLKWVREYLGGNVYCWVDELVAGEPLEGWLCPALLQFFEVPPQDIYIQVRAGS